jgi:PAS domain S-box-containing protein
MSPDWSEMRHLQGRNFIADTTDPSRSWLDRYIHPDDHEMVRLAIAKAIRCKTTFELEHRVIRVDGSLGWTYSRAVPQLSADGEVIEWFGTARDVSERKLAEEEIARLTAESERQRRLYEAVVSSTPDLVYVFDRNHRFVFANDSLLKLWGKTREEALGKNCLELGYEPWHAEKHDREIEEAVSSGRAVRGEVPFNGTAGRRIYDYIFVPVVGANGEVELVAGTTRDVTDRKITEEELRRANQDLEQFAYSASHDLKEPLRTVKIYSELLGGRYRHKLDGSALDFLENIKTGADRMEALVRDRLAYTQTSLVDKPSEPTDATATLETALANLKAAIAESGGLVKADALPSVAVHGTQLQSLFQNLIGNAIKYRRPEVAPVVRISARRQDDSFWLFCVADNGIGIEPAYREQIFGLFKRLHTSDEYSGTGIGLAICKRIVEHYHGRIWIESEVGEGCRFHFTVPG